MRQGKKMTQRPPIDFAPQHRLFWTPFADSGRLFRGIQYKSRLLKRLHKNKPELLLVLDRL
jgi:hypothetical protein